MLVSIIIPLHQTNDFFKICLESALAQTHKKLEIILACNGELTVEQCKNFTLIEDKRLVYLKTANGRHNARNEALEIAKGEWIQFLDYDDYLFPTKIEEQLITVLKRKTVGLCICEWKKFTKNINEYYFFPFQDIFDEPLLSSGKLVKKLGISGGFIATASWLVSKELVNGLKWIDSPNDDAVFLSGILKKSPSIVMIPKVLAGYRIHNDNTSSIQSKEEFDKLMYAWKIIHLNLLVLGGRQVYLYFYKAYLYLIVCSKQINKYRLAELIYYCFLFGFRAKVGLLIFRDLKNKLFK